MTVTKPTSKSTKQRQRRMPLPPPTGSGLPYLRHVKTPIYIEHYIHLKSDCYKVDLPWTRYRKHTVVLCQVTDGVEIARRLAKRELTKHMKEALQVDVPTPEVRHASLTSVVLHRLVRHPMKGNHNGQRD